MCTFQQAAPPAAVAEAREKLGHSYVQRLNWVVQLCLECDLGSNPHLALQTQIRPGGKGGHLKLLSRLFMAIISCAGATIHLTAMQ